MDRDPGDFDDKASDASDRSGIDRFEARLSSLPLCPGIPATDEEIAAADARAEADVAAGRVHSHADVSNWLRTWGSPDYKPFHEWRP